MNSNELEARVSKLENKLLEIQRINVNLMNQETVLRCMMHTLLAHMSDDHRKTMAGAYGMYLTSALEQLPPHLQNREVLQEFDEILSPEAQR